MRDEELIESILSGKTQLYEEIIKRYQNKVYSTVYSYTRDYEEAKDLTQEIFIKIYNNLPNFKNKSQFSTYLYRVAVNRCIDWTRKRRLKTVSAMFFQEEDEIEIYEYIADLSNNPEEILLKEEDGNILREVINNLPEIYRTVMIMFYFQDFSPQEIADILEIPRKTVDTRLYRARNMLRTKFTQKSDYGGVTIAVQPS